MRTNRPAFLALCIALGLATASAPTLAASSKANSASTGYPNGRPWQAMKYDFTVIKQKLYAIDRDIDSLAEDVSLIHEDLDLLRDDIASLSENVSALSNTLDVQVSVMPDAERNADNDAPVTVFVHVTHNGQAVTGLTADDFSYSNAFPMDGAEYCGAGCFTAGGSGVYAITLNGDWSVTSYAGALAVSTPLPSGATANGNSLVNFDIPAAP